MRRLLMLPATLLVVWLMLQFHAGQAEWGFFLVFMMILWALTGRKR